MCVWARASGFLMKGKGEWIVMVMECSFPGKMDFRVA